MAASCDKKLGNGWLSLPRTEYAKIRKRNEEAIFGRSLGIICVIRAGGVESGAASVRV